MDCVGAPVRGAAAMLVFAEDRDVLDGQPLGAVFAFSAALLGHAGTVA